MKKFYLFAIAVLFFSAGCFEAEQDVWVNPDGSARMQVVFGLSKELLEFAKEGGEGENPFVEMKGREAEIETDPNIKSAEFVEFDKDEVHYFGWNLELRDVTKLGDAYKKAFPEDSTEGPSVDENINVERKPNGNLLFTYIFHQDGKNPDELTEDDKMAQEMAQSMFEGKFFIIRLHGAKIMTANGEIDEQKQNVIWQIPMSEMMSELSYHKELVAEIHAGK